MWMTFDPQIGSEVCLLLQEEPGYAEQYGLVGPLTLLAKPGMIRTPFGIVSYVVWTVAVGTPAETDFEHFLNPNELSTLRLLESAASQTHFKLLIVERLTSKVTAFVDYENVFGLGELAEMIVDAMGHERTDDFRQAVEHIQAHVPSSVLRGLKS